LKTICLVVTLLLMGLAGISCLAQEKSNFCGDLDLRVEGSISSDLCVAGAGFVGLKDFPIVAAIMVHTMSSYYPTVIHFGGGFGVSFVFEPLSSTRITTGVGKACMGYGWSDTLFFAGLTNKDFSTLVFFAGTFAENSSLIANASMNFTNWLEVAVRFENFSDYNIHVENVGAKICFTIQPCEDASPVFIDVGLMHVDMLKYACPWETHREIILQLDGGLQIANQVNVFLSGFFGKEYTNHGKSLSAGLEVGLEINAP